MLQSIRLSLTRHSNIPIIINCLNTMTIQELKKSLIGSEGKFITLVLPDETTVPAHFHFTEVGYIKKEFVDCGGERRTDEKCLLQVWVAGDLDHRVRVKTLLEIFKNGDTVLPSEDLLVEIEYEHPHVSQFALSEVLNESEAVVLVFENKHTACLAQEACGIPDTEDDSCCSTSTGCC